MFLTKADKRINREQIVEEWRNALKELSWEIYAFIFAGYVCSSKEKLYWGNLVYLGWCNHGYRNPPNE